MSRIIKEPFAPRRRELSDPGFFYYRLKRSLVGFRKLAEASRYDLCMIVLLVSLLVTTLLLPWILL
jgi:hypothetical protein